MMGSPISFVVLCIAVASAVLMAVRRTDPASWKRVLDGLSYPLEDNGDDSLTSYGSWETYQEWMRISTDLGLALSPGKNYVCEWRLGETAYCCINSKFFLIDGNGQVSQVPVVSGSLLRGWTKLSADPWTLRSAEEGLAARCRSFVTGFSGEAHDRLLSLFLKRWSWALKDTRICPDGVAWHVPECYGGLGLPLPHTRQLELSRRGKHIALNLLKRYRADADSAQAMTPFAWNTLTKFFHKGLGPIEAACSARAESICSKTRVFWKCSREPLTAEDLSVYATCLPGNLARPHLGERRDRFGLYPLPSVDPLLEWDQPEGFGVKFEEKFYRADRLRQKLIRDLDHKHFEYPDDLKDRSDFGVLKYLWERAFWTPFVEHKWELKSDLDTIFQERVFPSLVPEDAWDVVLRSRNVQFCELQRNDRDWAEFRSALPCFPG